MITASNSLKDLLYQSRTVNIGAGATIEYNMNELLDNILVSTSITDSTYQIEGANPFKKLFPIDSIIKPNRPAVSGVKYYILRDADHTGPNVFYDYRTVPYPSASPRVYYPGVETSYKYWVTPFNTGVNLTVQYIIEQATITEVYSTGPSSAYPNRVVYRTSSDHGFNAGQRVSITGSGSSSFNLSNQVIAGVIDSKTFFITNSLAATSPQTVSKTATLVNSSGVASPTKPALANKIVIKFEKYHALPSTCTVVVNYKTGAADTPSAFNVPASGILNLYWNGIAWSTSEPFSSSQAISYPAPKEIRSIQVTTPAATTGGQIIGVIEISARWLKDVSSDVVSFNIEKESTSNPEDLLPVGNITANNITMELVRYNQSSIRVLDYNRDQDWTTTPAPNDVIYFAKNMQIVPHLKVFHSNGAVTEGSLKYDRINQGTFYLYNYSIAEHGEVSLEAMDAAKILMETLCPDLFYENSRSTSIVMSLLDAIGFTNYNINVLLDQNQNLIDDSIPAVAYWWTEESRTVWDTLQELCRDTQMNAFVDENNILQFYTRDKMYEDSAVDWEFYEDNTALPKIANIISFDKKDLPTANQVKVIWKTPLNSTYVQGASDLWSSDTSYLIAGGLRETIEADTPAENINFYLNTDEAVDPYIQIDSSFNYNGYFLINSEIFEYDAIEFEYVALNALSSDSKIKVFIANQGEWTKYRTLAKSGTANFYPTGRFRIKRRAVFGTKAARHEATLVKPNTWTLVQEDLWT